MGIGFVTPGGGGGPLPVGGDVSGTTSAVTVNKIAGEAVIASESTWYVDPDGSPLNSGKNPAAPTDFATAIAAASGVSNSNIVLANNSAGTYTTGGPITITATGVTLTARQGGTQSNSVIIADAVTVSGDRFRAYGVRFDGSIDLGPSQNHYFGGCSSAGMTISRTSPAGAVTITNCDFGSVNYTVSGAGSGSLIIDGAATTFGTINCGTATHTVILGDIASCGRVTLTAGLLIAAQATITDPALGIDAAAGTTVSLARTSVITSGGVPIPITVDGNYTLADVIYEPVGSSLGTPVGTPVEFSAGIHGYLPVEESSSFSLTPVTTTNPPGSPVLYLSLGTVGSPVPIDPAGQYAFIASYTLTVSASNTQLWTNLFINGAPPAIGAFLELFGLAAAQAPRTVYGILPGFAFGPSAYLDFYFAKNGGTGDVTIQSAYLALIRVA